MRVICLICMLATVAPGATSCVTTVSGKDTRKTVYGDLKEVVELPKKQVKKTWPKGTIVAVSKGEASPFGGILLSEKRAADAAKLRIAYNELYDVANINKKFVLAALKIADKNIQDADEEVKRLRKANGSWWTRNKFTVGIIIGVVLSAAVGGGTWGLVESRK